jgi:hypothetical protein
MYLSLFYSLVFLLHFQDRKVKQESKLSIASGYLPYLLGNPYKRGSIFLKNVGKLPNCTTPHPRWCHSSTVVFLCSALNVAATAVMGEFSQERNRRTCKNLSMHGPASEENIDHDTLYSS